MSEFVWGNAKLLDGDDRLRAARDLERAQDGGYVDLYRRFRKTQLPANELVRFALHHEREYLFLSLCEMNLID